MSDVGPNFGKGVRRIGQRRLSEGLVAIIDDRAVLGAAITELNIYAVSAKGNAPRRGIIFRVVSERERDAIYYKLQAQMGVEGFAEAASIFRITTGQWHVIDNHHLAHIHDRHADSKTEEQHRQVPITRDDLCQIPAVIDPRNIIDFRVARGMARIVYQKLDKETDLVAVEEIRRNDGLVVKTLYRQKK